VEDGADDDGPGDDSADDSADDGADDGDDAADGEGGDDDPTGDGADDGATDDDGDDGPIDDCPDEEFPALTPHPANSAYPDPELSVTCTNDMMTVEANGIPAYEFVQTTPNALQAQDHAWQVPLHPEHTGVATNIPLLGPAAVAVNGVPIYGPNEGAFPDPYGDPIYNDILDDCLGHTAGMGDYHNHALVVECLRGETPAGEPSPIIAYAFDGYPIYGPLGCTDDACSEVVQYQSGWVLTGNPGTYAWDAYSYLPSGDDTVLDKCNGRVLPDGTYAYHATAGFPYIIGCYAGTPVDNGGMGMPPT